MPDADSNYVRSTPTDDIAVVVGPRGGRCPCAGDGCIVEAISVRTQPPESIVLRGSPGTETTSGARLRGILKSEEVWSLVACAGLTFVPGLVVTNYATRYVVLSFLFLATAAVIIGLRILETLPPSKPRLRVGVGVLFLVAIGSVVSGHQLRSEQYGRFLTSFEYIEAIVARDGDDWAAGAQVVIALENTELSPTSGYNHWSTSYLRYLSGRSDITGLIGPVGLASSGTLRRSVPRPWSRVLDIEQRSQSTNSDEGPHVVRSSVCLSSRITGWRLASKTSFLRCPHGDDCGGAWMADWRHTS